MFFKPEIRLLLLILLIFLFTGIIQRLDLPPLSVHQWAQCDRLSVAWNYYNSNNGFFQPKVNNQDNLTGITGLEFPVVQYLVAKISLLIGFHEITYRMLTLIVFVTGLLHIYHISLFFIENRFAALGPVLLVTVSPLLQFYGFNFLPDIYSFSLIMMAWLYWLRYSSNNGFSHLICAFMLLTLAGLLKPTTLINALPMSVWILFTIKDRSQLKRIIPLLVLFFALSSGIVFSWYGYASWLSTNCHSEVFLMHLRPPQNWTQVIEIWEVVRKDWLERVYKIPLLTIIVFASLIYAFKVWSLQDGLPGIVLSSMMATLVYLWLMWLQMAYHDYYAITAMPFFVFASILLLRQLYKAKRGLFRWAGFALILLLFAHQLYATKTYIRTCYKKEDWKYSSLFFDDLMKAGKSLELAGINNRDTIISMFDHTPNVSLYLLRRSGVTVGYRNINQVLLAYLNRGLYRYIVFNRSSLNPDFPFDPDRFPIHEIYSDSLIVVYSPNHDFIPTRVITHQSPWN